MDPTTVDSIDLIKINYNVNDVFNGKIKLLLGVLATYDGVKTERHSTEQIFQYDFKKHRFHFRLGRVK